MASLVDEVIWSRGMVGVQTAAHRNFVAIGAGTAALSTDPCAQTANMRSS